MSTYWSFQLGLLGRHLRDSTTVFRHQSRVLEDEYGEACHFWNDQRGVTFAKGYLSPQLDLVPSVSTALATTTSHVDEARQAAEAAETGIVAVRSTAEGIEMMVVVAQRDAIKANQFAVDAIDRAHTVATKAAAVVHRVQVLGRPPI